MVAVASLEPIATADGTFAVVAMDQRGSLRRMLDDVGAADTPLDEIVSLKRDILTSLGDAASAFLIDPTYGVPAFASLPDKPGFGVLISAEPADRPTHGGDPVVRRDPDHDAAWIRSHNGDALKFLAQIRVDRAVGPDGRDLTSEALSAIEEIIADCAQAGVPSIIENLIYPISGSPDLSADQRADAIVEAAVALDALKPDLLKLEYPGSAAACRQLANRLTRPWAVLSAGVAPEAFADVLRISCDEGGASGFIAGRSIWRDIVGQPHPERVAFLNTEGRRRLEEFTTIIDGRARSFKEFI